MDQQGHMPVTAKASLLALMSEELVGLCSLELDGDSTCNSRDASHQLAAT